VPTDVVLLVASILLAATALVVAVMAVRTGRRRAPAASRTPVMQPDHLPRTAVLVPLDEAGRPAEAPERSARPDVLAARHVEGRVVVPPTDHQVVNAAMSRPHVRLAVLAHGIVYALRAESRDRIVALMQREYRRRRRERLAAGRRAVRAANPAPSPATDWTAQPWIGELPAHTSRRVES
jgi:hypothetical protein